MVIFNNFFGEDPNNPYRKKSNQELLSILQVVSSVKKNTSLENIKADVVCPSLGSQLVDHYRKTSLSVNFSELGLLFVKNTCIVHNRISFNCIPGGLSVSEKVHYKMGSFNVNI